MPVAHIQYFENQLPLVDSRHIVGLTNSFHIDKALLPTERNKNETSHGFNEKHSSLIRKRSLATPGLATRNSSGRAVRRALSTDSDAICEQPTWEVGVSSDSLNSHLSAIEPVSDAEGLAFPRAITPADMTCLGPFELGSLVITNGAASPEPGVLRSKASDPDIGSDRGYYTASEGRSSSESSEHATPSLFSDESPTFTHENDDLSRAGGSRQPDVQYTITEDVAEFRAQFEDDYDSLSLTFGPERPHPTASAHLDHALPEPAQLYLDRYSSTNFTSGGCLTREEERCDAVESERVRIDHKAGIYQNTKHCDTSTIPTQENGMATRERDRLELIPESSLEKSISSVNLVARPRQDRIPIPHNADSGYSSAESLRSVDQACEHARVLPSLLINRAKNSPQAIEQMCHPSQSINVEAIEETGPQPQPSRKKSKRDLLIRSLSTHSKMKLRRRSMPSLSSEDANTPAVEEPIPPVPPVKNLAKRLKKKRPDPYLPIIPSIRNSIADGIPEVPKDVRLSLSSRHSPAPEVEHLNHSYPRKSTHIDIMDDCRIPSIETTNPFFTFDEDLSEAGNIIHAETGFAATSLFGPSSSPSPSPPRPRRGMDIHLDDPLSNSGSAYDCSIAYDYFDESPYEAALSALNGDTVQVASAAYRCSPGSNERAAARPASAFYSSSITAMASASSTSIPKSRHSIFGSSPTQDTCRPRPKSAQGIYRRAKGGKDPATQWLANGTTMAQRAIARRNSFYEGKAVSGQGETFEQSFGLLAGDEALLIHPSSHPGILRAPLEPDEGKAAAPLIPSLPSIREQIALARAKMASPASKVGPRASTGSSESNRPLLSASTQSMLSEWEAQSGASSPSTSPSPSPSKGSKKGLPPGLGVQSRLWNQRRKGIGDALLAKLRPGPPKMVPPTIVVSRYLTPTEDDFPDGISRGSELYES